MHQADKIDISEMKLPKANIAIEDLTQFSTDKSKVLDKAISRAYKFKMIDLIMLIIAIILCIVLKDYIGITKTVIIILTISSIHVVVSTWIYHIGLTTDNAYQLGNDILYINYILNKDKERIYTIDASNNGTFIIYETVEWSRNTLISLEFRLLRGNKSAVKISGPNDGDIVNIMIYSDSIEIIKSKKVELNE